MNFDVFPLVAEIRTQSGDWSDGFDRNRFLDSFKVNNGVGSYLPIRTHTIEKQARIFKSIKFTLNDLNYELFDQDDSRDSSGLGALIARNACKASEQLVQWTRVPQEVNIDVGAVAYPTFQIPRADSFGSPSPGATPGFEYAPYTHDTPLENPTLFSPFGSNQWEFFTTAFGLTTVGFEIGNTPAATYLKAVADSAIFASQQEGAPIRGLLALHKLVTKFYRPAYDLSKRYEEFKEKKRSLNTEAGSNLSCNDVSKHQIASKLSFINTVQRRIDDFGDLSHLAGGYTYQEVSAFNWLSKKFLEDLKKRMDDEGVSYKNYKFYGLKPNFSYGKLIAESEKLGENVYFYHRRSSTSEREPYGVTLDIRYEGKSGIDSDIRYKNNGDYGDYYDLDHKVVEGVLYRKLKDFLEDDSISSDSYENIVARIPLLRIRSTDSQGLKNGSLYAGTAADNYLENYYRTYDETFTDTSVSPDFALHLFKQKIDSWCLKYIINQVTGMTLDEDHLGLNKRGLNKSRYEAILRPSNRDLDEDYFSFNDDSRQPIEQLPYDDEFKRNLRPSLQVEEGDVAPKIVPPKITNSDIILGQLVANSNIARDYRSLRDLKFDEVIAVPFHPRQKLLVDRDTTDPRFLDENGSVKEGFATIENNGLFIINPVCRIKIWTAPPPNSFFQESQGIVDLINQGFAPGGFNGLL